MKPIFLADGSSIFFRSFHAIRDLRRSDGLPTNALFGYISSLQSLIHQFEPDHIIVAFDRPEQLFREQIYKDYKANRKETPEELAVQIPYIKKVTELLGIPVFEEPGHEADDIIGTMALGLSRQNFPVVIVSGDKDLLQLINGSISVLRSSSQGDKLYKKDEVVERYGVPPEKLLDVFALMGDASDNIPGVPGIGEKTAIALIQEFGSLDALYENLDKISGKKKKENLIQFKEQAYLSRQLVTIKTDIPIDMHLSSFERKPVNPANLRAFYMDMEFRRFAEAISSTVEREQDLDYRTIQSMPELQELVAAIAKQKFCAVDTETTSLDVLSARIVGLSLAINAKQGWYVPLGHEEGGNLPKEKAYPVLKSILESETIKKVGHNLKYDYHIFKNEGITLRGILEDTLIISSLLDPGRQSHKLDDLAFSLLKMKMTPITDLIGKGKEQKCMKDVPIEQVSPYACEDADAAWRLFHLIEPQLQNQGMDFLYREIERPLIPVLANMERRGILVDPEILKQQSEELTEEMQILESAIFDSVGKKFNLNSPSQIAEILYDDLQILSGRKRSTRADILTNLANEGVQIAQQLLDYRHRQKIKSTYLDSLRKLIRPETGRVHTTFHQTITNTGRISSSDPNLQNIPTRTDLGRRVRRAFVASPGHVLLSLDYSQIELRILAHVSRDPGLLKAFAAGEDIHNRTAADIFSIPIEDVTKDMRRKAKEINFGLNYGMSPYGLAKRLGISDKEAANYIETYFTRYPNVQLYMDETVAFAKANLCVVTTTGRRIPTPGIRDANRMQQENAKRAAINAPIQGSAADLLKSAMVKAGQALDPSEAEILLTVHDELVIEVKSEKIEKISRLCQDIMEQALPISIPAPVEISYGNNWADLK